ncbi:hypothetical protein FNH05_03520 [Amycolatopsis rhizosphaerae]|uniref:A-factor biosynthesis hotdog domain-containing protein n=1 Tax=Amycolatopsis rhizosphaerae TaxID=2053003 RepID=A0A558DJG5_9PSEU|nr:AfsA-related hotdog domain-containing protein [Amycolatopsis rhizosphaerae]TVT61154.1 hypothetical protein FNH05_03520 [Amycolatopsis rhizosphaerae]
MTAFVVVGDRFALFAGHAPALTVSRVIDELGNGDGWFGKGSDPVVLAEGQGVTEEDWGRIRGEIARRDLADRFEIRQSPRGPLSGTEETHKHREENFLIAGLEKAGDHEFEASLRLHNDQELQLDHPGVHVQGMVILEAARQMYIAVCERYYTVSRSAERQIHVLDRMESSFRNFLYPVETRIRSAVVVGTNAYDLPTFDVRTEFRQAGLHIAVVRTTGTAMSRPVLDRKEARGAERAVRHTLRNLPLPARAQ